MSVVINNTTFHSVISFLRKACNEWNWSPEQIDTQVTESWPNYRYIGTPYQAAVRVRPFRW